MMSLTKVKSGPGSSVLQWYCQYGASSVGVPESYKSYAGLIRDDSVRWSITIELVRCLSVSRSETGLTGRTLGSKKTGMRKIFGGMGKTVGERRACEGVKVRRRCFTTRCKDKLLSDSKW